MLPRIITVALVAALVGCSEAPASVDQGSIKAKREARLQRATEQAARSSPKVTRHAVGDNELVRLDVLVPDESGLLETQHCFVWRDAEFKTASMTCPTSADVGVAPPMP